MNAVDLILLVVTFLIGYKLYSLLGTRNGTEKTRKTDVFDAAPQPAIKVGSSPAFVGGMDKIQKADRSFDPTHFLDGAEKAFEIILKAFLAGDLKTLKPLLSPSMYDAFRRMVKNRNDAQETSELLFFRLVKAEILESDVSRDQATVEVKFVSEQIILVKDKNGHIMDGDPDAVDHAEDIWVFTKSLKISTPSWLLSEIKEGPHEDL